MKWLLILLLTVAAAHAADTKAKRIRVDDDAGNFAGTNVEDVLAEIQASMANLGGSLLFDVTPDNEYTPKVNVEPVAIFEYNVDGDIQQVEVFLYSDPFFTINDDGEITPK